MGWVVCLHILSYTNKFEPGLLCSGSWPLWRSRNSSYRLGMHEIERETDRHTQRGREKERFLFPSMIRSQCRIHSCRGELEKLDKTQTSVQSFGRLLLKLRIERQTWWMLGNYTEVSQLFLMAFPWNVADESWHWVHRGKTWPKAATTMKRSPQSSQDLRGLEKITWGLWTWRHQGLKGTRSQTNGR